MKRYIVSLLLSMGILLFMPDSAKALELNNLESYRDRALVAIDLAGDDGAKTLVKNEESKGVFLSWRSYGKDEKSITYTIKRNGEEIASGISLTNYTDVEGAAGDEYTVVSSAGDETKATAWTNKYLELTLDCPAEATMPDKTTCIYSANDMSVGDLDGDGELELIVKWYPSNAQDNSKTGMTGKTYLDGYDIDFSTGEARKLWRIDLGINIRSGAHYTQYQVWDYDGDGKAEIAVKTAPGTSSYKYDEKGKVVKTFDVLKEASASVLKEDEFNKSYDYRVRSGYILKGEEYFTMFNGEDGSILDTVDYIPQRGTVSKWGDDYGNRVDRFLAGTAYLDGENPYCIMCRGYYTRAVINAYYVVKDGDEYHIDTYWTFDTDKNNRDGEGQGNHSLAVNDVDGDGRDEIVYGGMVIEDDGTLKYNTNTAHGDAMHVGDWVESNEGLEIMRVVEDAGKEYQTLVMDAETGRILMGFFAGKDVGRGMASDIDPTSPGAEWWSTAAPDVKYVDEPNWDSTKGAVLSSESTLEHIKPLSKAATPSVNFSIYWDGDLLAELQDHSFDSKKYMPKGVNITKWDYENNKSITLLDSSEIWSNNGTKGNMGLVGDVLGDWREEIITRCAGDNGKIRIYSTTIPTDYVVPTLLEDLAYREGLAWQNTAYNQPAHTSFLISKGLITARITKIESGEDFLEVHFKEACDGVDFGHEIVGYNIYRAKGDCESESVKYELYKTVKLSEFEKVDGELVFTDAGLDKDSAYSYRLNAIVTFDGMERESYLSDGACGHTVTPVPINEDKEMEPVEVPVVIPEDEPLSFLGKILRFFGLL